jgi:hypothetical protein
MKNLLFSLGVITLMSAGAIAIAQSTSEAPAGWFMAGMAPGDYETGLDTKTKRSGASSAFIRAKEDPKDFSTLMQVVDAKNYLGKRVRFSAWVKSDKVSDWAGLWMRVDGGKQTLSFDNMQDRPIKATTDWRQYEVVLDVPATADGVFYGILTSGTGQVWIDDAKLEIVPSTVATTGSSMKNERPAEPINLNFEK